ncbi:hypothetical protein, partial [Listeria welshimeri]|uniref:hypothetical protein n=1 Tax=Listeria welshimeri TaxID=1643 RepID=UPI003CFFDD72
KQLSVFCPAITSETLRLIAFRLLLCSVFKGQFLLLPKRLSVSATFINIPRFSPFVNTFCKLF